MVTINPDHDEDTLRGLRLKVAEKEKWRQIACDMLASGQTG